MIVVVEFESEGDFVARWIMAEGVRVVGSLGDIVAGGAETHCTVEGVAGLVIIATDEGGVGRGGRYRSRQEAGKEGQSQSGFDEGRDGEVHGERCSWNMRRRQEVGKDLDMKNPSPNRLRDFSGRSAF